MEPMQSEGTPAIPQEGQPVEASMPVVPEQHETELSANAVPSVEVESIPEHDSATAVTEHAAITVTVPDAHPSVLKRAVSLAHEIMRRVAVDGERILDEIEAVLFPKDGDAKGPDSADPGAGE